MAEVSHRNRTHQEIEAEEPFACSGKGCREYCKRGHLLAKTRRNRQNNSHAYCIECSRITSTARYRRIGKTQKYKDMARNTNLKRQFGITLELYKEMFDRQDGKCLICGNGPHAKSLHVDHDHDTGEIRGLLCNKCNAHLGWFERNQTKATAYINDRRAF